jgi:hypothetical protein
MKTIGNLLGLCLMLLLSTSAAVAGDFDWMQDFNIRAQADPSGFRVQLATSFRIGNAQVSTVLGEVDKPADAYMVLRLAEMSDHAPDYVLSRYKSSKGKGWGVLAKSLGIKPGSKEFHALKHGEDLYDDDSKGKGNGKSKGKGKYKD